MRATGSDGGEVRERAHRAQFRGRGACAGRLGRASAAVAPGGRGGRRTGCVARVPEGVIAPRWGPDDFRAQRAHFRR